MPNAVTWNVERQWDQSKLGRKNAPQFDTTAAAVRSWFWDAGATREHDARPTPKPSCSNWPSRSPSS